MMAEEALFLLAALCDDWEQRSPVFVRCARKVRAILAEVSPPLDETLGQAIEPETELATVRGERDDLVAFLEMAQWRYGARAVSKYAEGWRACAVAALDWIDKHQERTGA